MDGRGDARPGEGHTERIDSRFLEPACGSSNFLVQILRRKLAAVELKYGKSDFERRHQRWWCERVHVPLRFLLGVSDRDS